MSRDLTARESPSLLAYSICQGFLAERVSLETAAPPSLERRQWIEWAPTPSGSGRDVSTGRDMTAQFIEVFLTGCSATAEVSLHVGLFVLCAPTCPAQPHKEAVRR